MKKIVIINDISNVINPVGGPSICMKLLQNEIKRQSDIIITNTYDIYDSIVWHWSPIYKTSLVDKLINNGNIVICGPNSFFRGGEVTDYEKYLIENKKCSYLFMHPNQYQKSQYFMTHATEYIENTRIYNIIYPVDPLCYMSNGNIERKYDILFYKKFGCDDTYGAITNALKNYSSNTITYGKYKIKELIKLSSMSRCCIYLSCGETGGTACAEILCNGCPIISYYGNLTYGDTHNCIKLPDNGSFIYKTKLIEQYVQQCFEMDNEKIADLARDKFNLEKVTSDVISALYVVASHHLTNAEII